LKSIYKRINNSFRKELPFAVYNKPNSDAVYGIFQNTNELYTSINHFNTPSFVFAPFSSENQTVFFPLEYSEKVTATFSKEEVILNTSESSDIDYKDFHLDIVSKAIEAIKKNEFKKVVLSRKELVAISDFDICNVYNRLLQTYPNAFVYVWFHPEIGLWFGATPETLLKVNNNAFNTMALAGTQIFNENSTPKWTQKEIDEQLFVTDYIVKKISSFTNDIQVSEVETVRAGSLLHLKTVINGVLNTEENSKNLFSLINLLHPTPAVCGLPKETAKQFILENENYNRSYYTGYLGELNFENHKKNETNLFVNLRCMEIVNDYAQIYIGGGITKESRAEAEWKETVAKSNVMRKIL
jgi:isochorismate synthase